MNDFERMEEQQETIEAQRKVVEGLREDNKELLISLAEDVVIIEKQRETIREQINLIQKYVELQGRVEKSTKYLVKSLKELAR